MIIVTAKNYMTINTKHQAVLTSKAIPVQSWTGPNCSSSLKRPDFQVIGTWACQEFQSDLLAAFSPKNVLELILLEVELIPGP
jgi:hypothetical protein